MCVIVFDGYRSTYEIFDYLFDGAHAENEYEWHERRVATCRRHIGYLLEQSDE